MAHTIEKVETRVLGRRFSCACCNLEVEVDLQPGASSLVPYTLWVGIRRPGGGTTLWYREYSDGPYRWAAMVARAALALAGACYGLTEAVVEEIARRGDLDLATVPRGDELFAAIAANDALVSDWRNAQALASNDASQALLSAILVDAARPGAGAPIVRALLKS